MSFGLDPAQVKFIIENKDGTATITMKDGAKHFLPSHAASAIADVLNNEVQSMDTSIQAFAKIPESLKKAAEKTLRIKS